MGQKNHVPEKFLFVSTDDKVVTSSDIIVTFVV